ncbi:MAG: P-II family nitrogen regulator [Chloroflexi bacterium]|jgi:nitrogen regulatory protein P-II 1|nr:P-II family nitrogen regulator [Chloroflexota bacterium]MBT7080263.1 P-II family nitrogen regulator [Chloroflexota bacterium]MBT7289620.1 P-II family nitrogen regulator [Chloroflexota bacterium]
MKKVEAIIRYEKLNDVRDALEQLGYPGITITDVKGHGKQEGPRRQWRGKEYKVELLPKIKIEIVVLDEDLGKTVNAITRIARTGEVGDGKVFVIPVENAYRVRTGDAGENAI